MLFSVFFGKLLLLALNLKFLHKNDLFWIWGQLTKWSSSTIISTPIRIFEKILKFKFLLPFEFWMHFQCLSNSNYRMKRNFRLYYDVCHCNIHIWWTFQIFWNNFPFDVIFLHFFFKNSQKNQFPTKENLKILWQKKTCNFIFDK